MKDRSGYVREVKVQNAIGMRLAHDLTQIIPGKFKGRLFQKGHIIQQKDIERLLSIGKEHIYVLELGSEILHEDEAAIRLSKAFAGTLVECSEPHEGKVDIVSRIYGLAKIDRAFVDSINGLGELVMATVPTHTVVKPGQALVGTRVTPLVIEEAHIEKAEQLSREYREKYKRASSKVTAPVDVRPFRQLKVGLITTGGEVFSGRIADQFGPVVKKKIEAFGSRLIEQRFAPDDMDVIVQEIRYFQEKGAELILLTGGMSVDPDDRTPGAIRRSGARIVSYGTPMLPGSMLMMAYLDGVPVVGLPGCVMHDPYTSFDVLLPRICAGEIIRLEEIVQLGYGGLHRC